MADELHFDYENFLLEGILYKGGNEAVSLEMGCTLCVLEGPGFLLYFEGFCGAKDGIIYAEVASY